MDSWLFQAVNGNLVLKKNPVCIQLYQIYIYSRYYSTQLMTLLYLTYKAIEHLI